MEISEKPESYKNIFNFLRGSPECNIFKLLRKLSTKIQRCMFSKFKNHLNLHAITKHTKQTMKFWWVLIVKRDTLTKQIQQCYSRINIVYILITLRILLIKLVKTKNLKDMLMQIINILKYLIVINVIKKQEKDIIKS